MLQSILVKDYMTTNLITFGADEDIFKAIQIILKKNISGAPVVNDDGDLIGMLSEADCLGTALNTSYHEGAGGKVSDFMSTNVDTINADSNVVTAAEFFVNKGRRRMPVMEAGKLVGQISIIDILRATVSFIH